MTKDEIIMCADASGISLYGMGTDREKFIYYLEAFSKLILQQYRKATLDTIDALFDSEDPNPMYQTAYNHALIHMQEFIINMEKQ